MKLSATAALRSFMLVTLALSLAACTSQIEEPEPNPDILDLQDLAESSDTTPLDLSSLESWTIRLQPPDSASATPHYKALEIQRKNLLYIPTNQQNPDETYFDYLVWNDYPGYGETRNSQLHLALVPRYSATTSNSTSLNASLVVSLQPITGKLGSLTPDSLDENIPPRLIDADIDADGNLFMLYFYGNLVQLAFFERDSLITLLNNSTRQVINSSTSNLVDVIWTNNGDITTGVTAPVAAEYAVLTDGREDLWAAECMGDGSLELQQTADKNYLGMAYSRGFQLPNDLGQQFASYRLFEFKYDTTGEATSVMNLTHVQNAQGQNFEERYSPRTQQPCSEIVQASSSGSNLVFFASAIYGDVRIAAKNLQGGLDAKQFYFGDRVNLPTNLYLDAVVPIRDGYAMNFMDEVTFQSTELFGVFARYAGRAKLESYGYEPDADALAYFVFSAEDFSMRPSSDTTPQNMSILFPNFEQALDRVHAINFQSTDAVENDSIFLFTKNYISSINYDLNGGMLGPTSFHEENYIGIPTGSRPFIFPHQGSRPRDANTSNSSIGWVAVDTRSSVVDEIVVYRLTP